MLGGRHRGNVLDVDESLHLEQVVDRSYELCQPTSGRDSLVGVCFTLRRET
jgi:hypothetical protein